MRTSQLLLAIFINLLTITLSAQSLPEPQPAPRPQPSSLHLEGDLRLELYFPALTQGGLGLLRLSGDAIQSATLGFRGGQQPFFYLEGDAWYALLVADMNLRPGTYPLTVLAERDSGTVSFSRDLRIEAANFILQRFELPGNRVDLASADIESEEFALLGEITATYRPEPLWDASGFTLPLDSELSSPFGAFRLLNDTWETRHTGWDQRAPTGTPVRAMAAGEVVWAQRLEIRGNYVLLDHGLGIYSGYAHLSELHVSAGQRIAAGQIIGLSGNTGRSSAPHLHWELAVRGEWVDGAAFLRTWLPA